MNAIDADNMLVGNEYEPAGASRIKSSNGVITKIEPLDRHADNGRLVMPCAANAHDHGRPFPTFSLDAVDQPLETWLLRIAVAPPADPYLAACVSFARAALGGSGAVMMHATRTQGITALPEEVAEVARAAETVGIRAAFAVALRDRNPLVYGDDTKLRDTLDSDAREAVDRYFSVPDSDTASKLAQVDDCADAAAGTNLDLQYGPAGVQWCSDGLLKAIAGAAAYTGRRVHMHLLETRYQRIWADRHFPDGIVQYLSDIGLLGPQLTLAHCVWARDEELALIARSGATIAVNTSSNLHLRSGHAPVARMIQAGCRVALGLDGSAFDQDDDAVREMRLARLLNAGEGFSDNGVSYEQILRSALANGRRTIGAPGDGILAEGQPSDWIELDFGKLKRYCLTEVDPRGLLFAQANASFIRTLRVAGRKVVDDGRVCGFDLPAAEAQLISELRWRWSSRYDLRKAWAQIEHLVAEFYERLGCC